MTGTKPIRIVVAEDSPVTRLGVVTMLRSHADIEIVGEAPDGQTAVELFRSLRPDLVVLDMRMPGLDGIQATTRICGDNPPGKVLILTNYDGDEDIFKAIKAGASGYLTKGVAGDELLRAVRTVVAGERYLPPGVASRLADRMLAPSLSPRELQVIDAIARGLTNQQIADELKIARKTASMFVSRLLFKLNVSSRTEAVTVAVKRGILTPR